MWSRSCKSKKIKCGEEKPRCLNCERQRETCDYSIRLNWDGKPRRRGDEVSREPAIRTTVPGSRIPTLVAESLDAGSTVEPLMRSSSEPHFHHDLKEPGWKRTAWAKDGTVFRSPAERNITGGYRQGAASFKCSEHYRKTCPISQGFEPTSQTPTSLPSVPTLRENPSVRAQGQVTDNVLPSHRDKRQRLNDSYIKQHPLVHDRASRNEFHFRKATGVSPYVSGLRKEEPDKKGNYGDNSLRTQSTSAPSHEGNYINRSGKLLPPTDQSVTKSSRLSINSLLSGSGKPAVIPLVPVSKLDESDASKNVESVAATDSFYGVDRGLHDLDVPRNDDVNVLRLTSPAFSSKETGNITETTENDGIVEFGFGLLSSSARSTDIGYYVKPVPVIIPKSLEPLPPILLEDSMNLMYFHHFLNHTARILVPHDCSENPFKNILPQSELYFPSDMMVLVDPRQWLYRI